MVFFWWYVANIFVSVLTPTLSTTDGDNQSFTPVVTLVHILTAIFKEVPSWPPGSQSLNSAAGHTYHGIDSLGWTYGYKNHNCPCWLVVKSSHCGDGIQTMCSWLAPRRWKFESSLGHGWLLQWWVFLHVICTASRPVYVFGVFLCMALKFWMTLILSLCHWIHNLVYHVWVHTYLHMNHEHGQMKDSLHGL